MIDPDIDKREFWYEDFCTDVSNYLKKHEQEFFTYSWDHLSHTVDKDKLAVILSNFWHETR